MNPTVSFIVIAHNEAPNIERTLSSILAQDGGEREVLVVDDGSTDGTDRVVRALADSDPSIRLIRLDANRGRGFARDRGVTEARGRYIATVDADIVLPEDWLARCVSALRDADAVAGTAVPDGDVAYIHSRFRLEPKVVNHATPVTGSNAVYKREIFDRVGFDPSLREGEDVALGYALAGAAANVQTIAGLVVLHQESKSFTAAIAWMHQSGRGAARQLFRYRRVRVPDVAFAGWLAAGALGVRLGQRNRAWICLLPIGYALIVAAGHIWRAFTWDRRHSREFASAIITDVALLTAYFSGRLAGVALELVRWRR